MKERPILFKPEMVRAILEGRKTQTRRMIKNVMPDSEDAYQDAPFDEYTWQYGDGHSGKGWYQGMTEYPEEGSLFFKCPYGIPGDRLWVRETFAIESNHSIEFVDYKPPFDDGRPIQWDEDHWEQCHYRATDPAPDLCYPDMEEPEPCVRWKPSIHMPRWASRILLEVTDIRVELLSQIKRKDAFAEGVVKINKHFLMDPEVLKIPVRYNKDQIQLNDETYWGNDNPIGAFFSYWDKINGDKATEINPWVWVVEFKEVKLENNS